MPRNTRQWARRELDRAASLVDNIGKHLNGVEEVYRPQHENIAEACLSIMVLLRESQKLIEALRAKI